MKTSNAELDITAGLTGTYFLNVGDQVADEKGDMGEVLGFSANGDPVVLFQAGERVVDMNKETLVKQGVYKRPGVFHVAKRTVTHVPLEKAAEMGFVKEFGTMYTFQGTPQEKTARYPWEVDSVWHVQEKEGRKFLVKEENVSVGNPDNKPKSQLDNDNGNPGFDSKDFNIFD